MAMNAGRGLCGALPEPDPQAEINRDWNTMNAITQAPKTHAPLAAQATAAEE